MQDILLCMCEYHTRMHTETPYNVCARVYGALEGRYSLQFVVEAKFFLPVYLQKKCKEERIMKLITANWDVIFHV